MPHAEGPIVASPPSTGDLVGRAAGSHESSPTPGFPPTRRPSIRPTQRSGHPCRRYVGAAAETQQDALFVAKSRACGHRVGDDVSPEPNRFRSAPSLGVRMGILARSLTGTRRRASATVLATAIAVALSPTGTPTALAASAASTPP